MTSALTERAGQWADLENLAAGARAGRGRVALLDGPVASGKTTLLHAFAQHAAESGATVLMAACAAPERSLPFGVVGQLLDTDLDPAADAGVTARAVTVSALCRALLRQAGDTPLLIGIDDVQHIDDPSLDWLLSFIRRTASAKVLVVLTETAGARPAHSPLHTELLRHPHCRRIGVAPLSAPGVAALFGGAESAYAITGGNPLLVRALLEDGGVVPGPVVPGPGFQRALLSCLHRCAPDVVRVARALAVLGGPAVGDLIGSGPEAMTPAAAFAAFVVLNAAGLLDDGRFRHPAARSCVLDDMSSQQRRTLRLRAAALLHDRGDPAAEVAPFLLAGDGAAGDGAAGDDLAGYAWTGAVLAEAAEHALRGERVEEAVRYLELARRTVTDDAGRPAIVAALARIEWRIRPAAALRHLPVLMAASASGDLGDRDATALVRLLVWHGRVGDAASVLDEVRRPDRAPRPSGAAGRQVTELWLAFTHPSLARRGQPPVPAGTGPGDPAGPWPTSTAALADVLLNGAGPGGPPEQAVTDAEHVLQAARPSGSRAWGPESAVQALLVLLYADRLDLAWHWADLLRDQAPTVLARALFTSVLAEVALRRGALSTAFDEAGAALDLLPRAGWGVAAGFPLATAITAATRMGRLEEAADHLAQPVPESMLQSRYGLHYLHARGEYYLATGRDYAALADFLSCGELMASWGMDVPGLVPWRTSAADAWLRRGENRAEARRLVNEQLAKVGPGRSRTRGVALRLLAATSQVGSRPQLLAEAVAILEGCDDRFELARALADLSRAYRAAGRHRRASPMARRAWETAEDCGALALCQDVLPLCTTVDTTRPQQRARFAALTEGELRVAALAASGFTNREIAEKLFITPSTIEQHLTRVYRKLDVKFRKELPAELQAHLAATA